MRWRRKHVLLSLLAVGSGLAVAWYASSSDDHRRRPWSTAAGATLRAKVVDEVPTGATVVRPAALENYPVARALVEWAARTDAREEWVGDVVEGQAGRRVVTALQGELPHYRAPDRSDTHQDGVYVECEGRVVVLTAAGWSVAPEAH